MKTKIEKNKYVFSFGILSLLMTIIYIKKDFCLFFLFLVISFLCFLYSKQIWFKTISKPIIKRIIELNNRKLKLLEEVKILEINKKQILKYILNKDENIEEINKYKEIVKQLRLKEKELNIEIIKLEDKKRTVEQIAKQEQLVIGAIEREERTFDILSQKNSILISQKEELEKDIKKLTNKSILLNKKKDFIKKCNFNYIDNINGYEFEKFIAELLGYLGYREVTTTKESSDYGIDVVAVKDSVRYAIQCKNYSQSVGNNAIQEAYSGKNFYDCHVAIVVTNNYFTNNANNQAKMNKVVLWDRSKLTELMRTLTEM